MAHGKHYANLSSTINNRSILLCTTHVSYAKSCYLPNHWKRMQTQNHFVSSSNYTITRQLALCPDWQDGVLLNSKSTGQNQKQLNAWSLLNPVYGSGLSRVQQTLDLSCFASRFRWHVLFIHSDRICPICFVERFLIHLFGITMFKI